MEFKGTKGKWVIDKKYHLIYSDDKNIIGNIICESPDLDCEESFNNWNPNAKLISKAPELLEMLQSIVNDFEGDYVINGVIVDDPYPWLIDRYKEAKQLIKEATTI